MGRPFLFCLRLWICQLRKFPIHLWKAVRAIIALRFTRTAVLMLAFGYRLFRRFEREDLFAGLRLGSFMFLAYAFQTAGLQYTTP